MQINTLMVIYYATIFFHSVINYGIALGWWLQKQSTFAIKYSKQLLKL